MLELMKKKEINWVCHWLRRNCLLKDALERVVNGKKVCGRRKISDDRQHHDKWSVCKYEKEGWEEGRVENAEFAVKGLPLGRTLRLIIVSWHNNTIIYLLISYLYDSLTSVSSDPAELILQAFRRFTYVTAHSPTLTSLYLRHSSFSNPSVASPTSQLILKPFFRFSYITGFSLTSPGEPPMTLRKITLSKHI